MTDEKYTFIEDVREKKKTATGAHHKRTHCGKGGAIRFPSDFKSKKELRAMNGEVKSYKLNDPMSWAEFKAMPDDIKITYITALRKRYNVSDTKIEKMLGVSSFTFCKEMKRLGISAGQRSGRTKWDVDGWYAWVNGVPVEAKEEVVETVRVTEETAAEDEAFAAEQERIAAEVQRKLEEGMRQLAEVEKCDSTPERIVPRIGQMELNGTVEECVKTLQMLLEGSSVKLTVAWAVKCGG